MCVQSPRIALLQLLVKIHVFCILCSQHVDYVAVDDSQSRLLFYTSEAESLMDLKIPSSVLRKSQQLSITTDYVDSHMYVFSR